MNPVQILPLIDAEYEVGMGELTTRDPRIGDEGRSFPNRDQCVAVLTDDTGEGYTFAVVMARDGQALWINPANTDSATGCYFAAAMATVAASIAQNEG